LPGGVVNPRIACDRRRDLPHHTTLHRSAAAEPRPAEADFVSADTLFAAGGALGVAFERQRGRLRLEVEGMARDTYDAPFTAFPSPGEATLLTNNWSVMTNAWRDLMLNYRFGVYGGGLRQQPPAARVSPRGAPAAGGETRRI
jgi:hypothetical protein